MARPTDWNILDLDHDPTPGEPYRVKELGGRLRDLGDDAERAARDVRGLAGDPAAMNWIGASGDAFRDHIGKFPGQLDKVATSHHLCADALIVFGTALDGFQSQADRALVQARPLHDQVQRLQQQLASAHTDLTAANKGVTAAQAAATVDPTSVHNAIQSQTTAQSAVDSLNTQLSGPAAQLEALKKLAHSAESLRNTAEDTARTKINAATDAGIPPDSFWHKLGDVASALWHGLVIVAKIVSLVGAIVLLIVGGPLWLIVAVVVAGLIILADTLYKYANGQASLWDVGLAILSCIPITKGITSMAAVADAFRAGGMLGAGLHIGGAVLGAAKDMVVGVAGLLRAGGGILRDSAEFLSEAGRGLGSGKMAAPEDVMAALKAMGAKVASKAGYTTEDGHYYATRVLEGGRADGETVLAGHGVYYAADGNLVVPPGTKIAVYCPHDAKLPGLSGVAVEGGVYPGDAYHIYEAGEEIPNYTLKAPSAPFGGSFTVFQNSQTVANSTKLADLVHEGQGLIHWAACTEVVR